MPISIAEHFDAIWIITTFILGLCLTLIIYFLRVWKHSVDDAIEIMQTKMVELDKEMIRNYVSKADCSRTEGSIQRAIEAMQEKMENLSGKVDKYHNQIMYEFGVRNGNKRKDD